MFFSDGWVLAVFAVVLEKPGVSDELGLVDAPRGLEETVVVQRPGAQEEPVVVVEKWWHGVVGSDAGTLVAAAGPCGGFEA